MRIRHSLVEMLCVYSCLSSMYVYLYACARAHACVECVSVNTINTHSSFCACVHMVQACGDCEAVCGYQFSHGRLDYTAF